MMSCASSLFAFLFAQVSTKSLLIFLSCATVISGLRGSSCILPFGRRITIFGAEKSLVENESIGVRLADALITQMFNFKPLFKIASKNARDQIIDKGLKIDVDWLANVARYERDMDSLSSMYDSLCRTDLEYPNYYLQPFHAYEDGNLSWKAAMEVESAALIVHAALYTENRAVLDRTGDFLLRDRFHQNMINLISQADLKPQRVVDLGCSTGLSTMKLHESFPHADVFGIDLSPYMLAVASHQLCNDPAQASARGKVWYIHGAAEATGLEDGTADLISISLVAHELPESAARAVFSEARRMLRPGGAIALMDIDPDSDNLRRLASNPFAFAAFRSTEPWLQQYISMDLYATLVACGFANVQMLPNSPQHRTVVAFK